MSSELVPPPYGAPQFRAPQPAGPQPGPQRRGGQATYAPIPTAEPLYPVAGHPGWGPPPPALQPPWLPTPGPRTRPPQRPAVIAVAASLAVVGSLLWICALSLLWVTAVIGTGTFAQIGDNGAVFHILNRFTYRMTDGLAVPLYAFPLASLVTGFLIMSRRPWARLVHTLVGAAALAWAAWWLHDNLLWWFSAAWYVVVGCLVLWTPGATAWYRWRSGSEPTPPAG